MEQLRLLLISICIMVMGAMAWGYGWDPDFTITVDCTTHLAPVGTTVDETFTVTVVNTAGYTDVHAFVCVDTNHTLVEVSLDPTGHGTITHTGYTSAGPLLYQFWAYANAKKANGDPVHVSSQQPAYLLFYTPGNLLPFAAPNIPVADCPVNLVTGDETHDPDADLSVYNPAGPAVSFTRTFSNFQSKCGYGSPGLAPGWTHEYDQYIEGSSLPGAWGPLTLHYPNGSLDILTPELNMASPPYPTGNFIMAPGTPYTIHGYPGLIPGQWAYVTVTDKQQNQYMYTMVSFSPEIYRLSTITDCTGHTVILYWDNDQRLTSIRQFGMNPQTLLTLDYTNGYLVDIFDCHGREVTYHFDVPGGGLQGKELMTVSQIFPLGQQNGPNRYSYQYQQDPSAQAEIPLLASFSEPSPTGTGISTISFTYLLNGKVATQTDPNGNVSSYTYNTGNTLVERRNAQNVLKEQHICYYNQLGLSTGTWYPDGYRTYQYYSDTNNPYLPTSFVDKDGKQTSYTYDAYGNTTSVTNPRSVTTTYTYGYTTPYTLGLCTQIQEGSKTPTTITYYGPLPHTITYPKPGTTDGSTVTTQIDYDFYGNVTDRIEPGNNAATTITTFYNYTTDGAYTQMEARGQPLTLTDNLGHVTHYRYDARGNCVSVTDAIGNQTLMTYNLADQRLSTILPATGQSGSGNGHVDDLYQYPGGLLAQERTYDEGNNQNPIRTTSYTYGNFGELLQRSGSDETVSYQYDACYHTTSLSDGNNHATTYTYDLTGHLTQVQYPGNQQVHYTSFDPVGRILTRVDGNSVTTNYTYSDAEGMLTNISYPATPTKNVAFSYDSYGRRTGMTDGTGSHSYTYDQINLPLTVTTTYTGLASKTISYAYYDNGIRSQMTSPAGNFTYYYDGANRLSSLTDPFSHTITWSYQNNNWLSQQTYDNNTYALYARNALGQLTRLRNYGQNGSQLLSDYLNLTHDGAGNLVNLEASIPAHTAYSGVTTYAYDTKNQLTGESSTRYTGYQYTFTYDSAGNPTTFKGTTHTYNNNNQLTNTGYAYDGNGNPTTYGGTTLTFDPENRMTAYGTALTADYCGDNLRAWKDTTGLEGGTRKYFLYDGTRLLHEMEAAGTIIATNTWGTDGLAMRNDSRGSVYYLYDPQGNVAHRADQYGTILSNDLYDGYGSLLDGGDTIDPYGYNAKYGYYLDQETGLNLCTFRYYDPQTGRWLTRDPISYAGGVNLYSYCSNGPVLFSDANGTAWYTFIVIAGGGSVLVIFEGAHAIHLVYECYKASHSMKAHPPKDAQTNQIDNPDKHAEEDAQQNQTTVESMGGKRVHTH